MDLKKNFQKKVLSNGMTVIFEKRNVPVVSVAFVVRYGSVNETLEEKGIAHFMEHMMFKGTKTRTHAQITGEIEKRGGDMNASTSDVCTFYFCKIPSRHLNIALDVLSDMIKNPLFDKKEFEKERKVILEEIKMYKDNPRMHVFNEIQMALYNGTMGLTTAGTAETVNSISREDMVKKFKEIYTPNNMALVVVGDADFNEVVDYVDTLKGTRKNFGNEKGEIPVQKFGLKNEEKTETRKGIDQANLVFAFHGPLAGDKKHYASQVLIALLAEGMSSRLWNEIREKRNLAYAVKGMCEVTKDFAYNLIYVATMKENVELVKEIILKEFKDVAKELDEKELEEIKEQLVGNYQISMEDSQSQMIGLLSEEINGSAENFYDFEKNIRAVKLEDVKEIAKTATENFSFYALVPEK